VSSDYKGGNECMGPMAHVLRSLCSPLIRVLISNTINLVPVDHVAETISNNIRPIDNKLNIVYSTCKETLTTHQILKHVNPNKGMLFFKNNSFTCRICRRLELLFYRTLVLFRILSLKKYLAICLFYRNYVYFQDNLWNFEDKSNLPNIDILRLLMTYATNNKFIK